MRINWTHKWKTRSQMTDYFPLRSKCSPEQQDGDDQRCCRTGSLVNLQTHACSSLLATNTPPLFTDAHMLGPTGFCWWHDEPAQEHSRLTTEDTVLVSLTHTVSSHIRSSTLPDTNTRLHMSHLMTPAGLTGGVSTLSGWFQVTVVYEMEQEFKLSNILFPTHSHLSVAALKSTEGCETTVEGWL